MAVSSAAAAASAWPVLRSRRSGMPVRWPRLASTVLCWACATLSCACAMACLVWLSVVVVSSAMAIAGEARVAITAVLATAILVRLLRFMKDLFFPWSCLFWGLCSLGGVVCFPPTNSSTNLLSQTFTSFFCQQDTCLPETRRPRQSEKPTVNTPVTVTPETRAACFISPGASPGKGAWSGMLLRSPVTRRRIVFP